MLRPRWPSYSIGFGPPARNRKKNRKNIENGLPKKIGKKSPKNRKMAPKPYCRAIFPFFGLFFSYFLGEAVSYVFPISGRRPETYSVAGQRGLNTSGIWGVAGGKRKCLWMKQRAWQKHGLCDTRHALGRNTMRPPEASPKRQY